MVVGLIDKCSHFDSSDNDSTMANRLSSKHVVDVIWSTAVVCPLIIIYWSGTWRLLDLGFASFSSLYGAIYCVLSGLLTTVSGYVVLPLLARVAGPLNGRNHMLVSRAFLYFYAVGVIAYWRGVWNLAEYLIGLNLTRLTSLCIFSELTLIGLKGCTSAIGSPFAIELDSEAHFYHTFPRFRTLPNKFLMYLADACFTTVIIQTLAILVWFTLWSIGDILILPGETYRSYIVSLFSGYVVVFAVFIVQSPVYQIAYDAHLRSPLLALAIEDLYKVVATISTLNVWRGIWGLVKDFIFTDESGFLLALSYHAIGFVVMIAIGVGRTLASVGCAVDAEMGHATGTIWPIYYFRNRNAVASRVKTRIAAQPHLRVSLENDSNTRLAAHII